MSWSQLTLVLALTLSFPVGVVAVGVLAQHRTTGKWLRRHARAFPVLAAAAWAVFALVHWHQGAQLRAVLALVLFLFMVALAVTQRPPEVEQKADIS